LPVITIAQSKGGAGKTTLALALASEFEALGGSVFMLDADRQNSLLNWHRDRLAAGRGGDSRIMVEDASQLRDADIGSAINKANW
jgi:chromosome partitioning protein